MPKNLLIVQPANGKTLKRSREPCASRCTTYIIYNEGQSGLFFLWGQGCRVKSLLKLKKKKSISLTKQKTKKQNQGSRPTGDRLSGASDFQEPQVRAGAGGGEEAGTRSPARAPSGYVMVSLRRVPAPIRVLHRCSASVAAQLFSGGLLSGDVPQGTTTTQNPGTRPPLPSDSSRP